MEPLHPTDPLRIGDYRLTQRLGSGGMGQVYLARTPSGRRLVIKVIRPDLAHEDGFRARFAREADAARRVGGFHTAQVVDADPDADPPWIATAHIPGPSLEQSVRDHGPITPPALYVLATGLAEGLQAIHGCGLVHRDLKPANIILADDGPRIIDFGIARPLDADSMTTRGAVFGTLPYMSPEQTDGSRVSPASDMFSLGTVLAYTATGTNPFQGATMAETLRRLISPPPHPGEFDPDLRALVIECWNHDPDQRPTPAQILTRFESEDLRDSWPPTRNRAAPIAGPPSQAVVPAPDISQDAPAPPMGDPFTGTAPSGGLRPTVVVQAPPGAADAAAPSPYSAAGKDSGGRVLRHEWWPYYTAAVCVVALLGGLLWWRPTLPGTTLRGYGSNAESVAFSPDGTLFAAGSEDGTTRLWDVDTGELVTTLTEGDGSVESVAFSPDGTTFAAGGHEGDSDYGTIRLWDVDTFEGIATLTEHEGRVHAVAFSPDGTTLAVGSEDPRGRGITVRLWDVGTGEPITILTRGGGGLASVAFSPDGTTLATNSEDGDTQLWDVGTGEPITTLNGRDGGVASVAFSPDGTTLVTGRTTPGDNSGGVVELWDTDTGSRITVLTGHHQNVYAVAFSPDGTTFASGGSENVVRLWNADTFEETATLARSGGAVYSMAFSPDGTTLATGGQGSTQLHEID